MTLRVISVGTIQTEIYYLLADSPTTKTTIVIIPGNPGIVDFYIEFVDMLFEHLKRRYSVFVVGHGGHGAPRQNGQRLFSLQDQIAHKIAFLELLSTTNMEHFRNETEQLNNTSSYQCEEFILMGHSIGAYIAFKVMKRRPDFRIRQVFALMPTIQYLWNGLSPVIKFACLPIIRNIFAFIVCSLPSILSLFVARLVFDSTMNQKLNKILTQKREYYIARNCLYMAYCEAKEVVHLDVDCEDILKSQSHNVVLIFARNDRYVPLSFVNELQKRFPALIRKIHFAEPHVSHAFVLNHSVSITQQIVSLIDLEG